MSVSDTFHNKVGRKPGLYNEAGTTTNSSCSCDAASPFLLPTPRLPSSLPHIPPTTTTNSPLLRSSSFRVSTTPTTTPTTVVTTAVTPDHPMTAAVTLESRTTSRYAGLSPASTSPTRPPHPRQPSRSERMLRATLDRDQSLSCSSKASISDSHPPSRDPSCSSSTYDPFTSTTQSAAARHEFPPYNHLSRTAVGATASGATSSASTRVSPSSSSPRISHRRLPSSSGALADSIGGMRDPGVGMIRTVSENVGLGAASMMAASGEGPQELYYYAMAQARPSTPTQQQQQPQQAVNASSRTKGKTTSPLRGGHPQSLQRIHSSPADSPPTLAAALRATGNSPSSYCLTRTAGETPVRHSHVDGSCSHVRRPTTPSSVASACRYHRERQHEESPTLGVTRSTTFNNSRSPAYNPQHQRRYYNRDSSPSPSSASSHQREHKQKDREHHHMPSSLSHPHSGSQSTQSNYATLTQAWVREAFIGDCDTCSTPHRSSSPSVPPPDTSTTTLMTRPAPPTPASPAIGSRFASHSQLSPSPSRPRIASSPYYQFPATSSAERPRGTALVTNMPNGVPKQQRSLSPSPSSAELTTSRSSSRETDSLDDDSDSDSDACDVPVHFNFAPRPAMPSAQRRTSAVQISPVAGTGSGASNKFLTPPPSPQHVSPSTVSPVPNSTTTINQNRHGRSKSQSQTSPHRSSSNTSSKSNSTSSSAWPSRHSADMCAAGFDACKASAQLRLQEGYVSFADVQGLGRVDDDADEYEDDDARKAHDAGATATGKWLLGLLGR